MKLLGVFGENFLASCFHSVSLSCVFFGTTRRRHSCPKATVGLSKTINISSFNQKKQSASNFLSSRNVQSCMTDPPEKCCVASENDFPAAIVVDYSCVTLLQVSPSETQEALPSTCCLIDSTKGKAPEKNRSKGFQPQTSCGS